MAAYNPFDLHKHLSYGIPTEDDIDRRLNLYIGTILIISFLLNMAHFTYCNALYGHLNSYEYSEFFINYQGGFVRRGLLGEIMYQLYRLFPFPIKGAIFCFSVAVFFGVVAFFYRQFKKHGICWWLMMSPLFMNFTNYIVRKDYLLYAILIIIVYLLGKSSRDILNKSVACLLVLFSLFIHEAFIFWGFTLYAIILLTDEHHKILNRFLVAIPVIATTIIISFKGTTEVAETIVSSWNSVLPDQPLEATRHNSIGAIGWNTLETFLMHIKLNVSLQTGYGGFVLIPLLLIAAYYLFSKYMIYFSKGTAEERNAKRLEISLLYPVFCITLIPMLTILSCDTGRVFQYATVATFSAFFILPQQRVYRIFPQWYKTIIQNFNNWLDLKFPSTRTSLLFLLTTLAVSGAQFNLNSCWYESIIGSTIYNGLFIGYKTVKFFFL